jgi:hypothetical protein
MSQSPEILWPRSITFFELRGACAIVKSPPPGRSGDIIQDVQQIRPTWPRPLPRLCRPASLGLIYGHYYNWILGKYQTTTPRYILTLFSTFPSNRHIKSEENVMRREEKIAGATSLNLMALWAWVLFLFSASCAFASLTEFEYVCAVSAQIGLLKSIAALCWWSWRR